MTDQESIRLTIAELWAEEMFKLLERFTTEGHIFTIVPEARSLAAQDRRAGGAGSATAEADGCSGRRLILVADAGAAEAPHNWSNVKCRME
jgi:hypothetical protein